MAEPEAEPEAKADPEAWGGYAGYGLGYRGYGYGLGYAGYGYPYASRLGYYGHYLGKRSADAEPEAKANPEAWYGGYGYGRGYYGGYYGRGYYGGYPYRYGYGRYWG